jgi:predicted negative regulator of RcsB-dependent stress response
MTLDAEEKHQVDQVKTWFKAYGKVIAIVIVVALVVFLVWQRWHQMHERSTAHASLHYEKLLDSMAANDADSAQKAASYLIDRYPASTYAKLATLLLARNAVASGDYAAASQKLQWVMDTAKVPSLRAIARLRYARLQIQLQQPKTALTVLQKIESDDYQAAAEEIKGDAFVALQDSTAAKGAYQNALNALPVSAVNRPLLQMKFNNIAVDA